MNLIQLPHIILRLTLNENSNNYLRQNLHFKKEKLISKPENRFRN